MARPPLQAAANRNFRRRPSYALGSPRLADSGVGRPGCVPPSARAGPHQSDWLRLIRPAEVFMMQRSQFENQLSPVFPGSLGCTDTDAQLETLAIERLVGTVATVPAAGWRSPISLAEQLCRRKIGIGARGVALGLINQPTAL